MGGFEGFLFRPPAKSPFSSPFQPATVSLWYPIWDRISYDMERYIVVSKLHMVRGKVFAISFRIVSDIFKPLLSSGLPSVA